MKHFTFIILLIFISLFLIPPVFAEPEALQQGIIYNANQPFHSDFNVDIIIQRAKKEGYWVRIGLESNSTYYEGTIICSKCSFYNEDEFFKGNRLYAYPEGTIYKDPYQRIDYSNTFLLYIERDDYQYRIGIFKNNMNSIFIDVTPKTNIETNTVKEDIKSMFLTLGLSENSDDISFFFSEGRVPDRQAGRDDQQNSNTSLDLTNNTIMPIVVGSVLLLIVIVVYFWKIKK